MNLILDVGNTFAKLAVYEQDVLREKRLTEKTLLQEKAEELLLEYPSIDKIILSRVARASFALPEPLREKINFLELGTETLLPFDNRYATPQTLGNDRKALVAAASKHYRKENVLVIDAGSCLTFDFKNSKNEYLGGSISPGLQMRYKAINAFTANLPLLEPLYRPELIGDSTINSIHSGVYLGMLSEIEGIIARYSAETKALTIIFTGGDAQILSKRVKNSIFANSNFLLEGLNYILEFNSTQ